MEEENVEEEFEKAEMLFNQFQTGGAVEPITIVEEPIVVVSRFATEHPDKIVGYYSLEGVRTDPVDFLAPGINGKLQFRSFRYHISSAEAFCYGVHARGARPGATRVDVPTWLIPISNISGVILTGNGKFITFSNRLRTALQEKFGADIYIPITMYGVNDLGVDVPASRGRNYKEVFDELYNKSLNPAQVEEFLLFVNSDLQAEIEAEEQTRREEEERKLKLREEALAKVADRVKLISEICEFIYGDNFELRPIEGREWKANSADRYKLTIHFPEIIIRNSKRRKHTITNLYVAFFFNELMEHTSGWHGIRGTLSLEEAVSGYSHSHLSRSCWSWSGFCLGSGEVTNIYADLIAAKFNPDTFRKAMLALLSYVEWESLEGGPYIQMSDIMGRSSRPTLPPMPNESNIHAYASRVINGMELPLNWVTLPQGTGKFVVNVTPNYEKSLLDVLPPSLQVRRASNGQVSPIMRDTSDSLSQIRDFNRTVSDSNSCLIIYKGATIRPTVQLDLQPESIAERVIMPNIVEKINGKIEELINLHYLKTI